jgi:hypothetical protein
MSPFQSLVDPISTLKMVNVMRAARNRPIDDLPELADTKPQVMRDVKSRKYQHLFDAPIGQTMEFPAEIFDRVQAVAYKRRQTSPNRYKLRFVKGWPVSYITRIL